MWVRVGDAVEELGAGRIRRDSNTDDLKILPVGSKMLGSDDAGMFCFGTIEVNRVPPSFDRNLRHE